MTWSEVTYQHLYWTPSGSYKIGSVRPSILPSVILFRLFFGIISLVFYEIWHGARNSWSCAWQSWIFWESFFLPQNWEKWPKMGQKQGFFNLLENLVINFYWICSIMNMFIICCISAQIQFLICRPKYSQPIKLFLHSKLNKFGLWALKLTLSLKFTVSQ